MKNSNIQQRKLTKNELKTINGGGGPSCIVACFCEVNGEMTVSSCTLKGQCCSI